MSRKSVLMATLVLTTLSGMSITPALAQGHMGTPQEQQRLLAGRIAVLPQGPRQ